MNWGHVSGWPRNKERKDLFHDDIMNAILDYIIMRFDYSAADVLAAFKLKTDQLLTEYAEQKKSW